MSEQHLPAEKVSCPHAPVFQNTPIGPIRVWCPWCKHAELALSHSALDAANETIAELQALLAEAHAFVQQAEMEKQGE